MKQTTVNDTKTTKPDIIVFMMDQLAAKWLEQARQEQIIATPSFDRLRAMGVEFTSCISSNPLCAPARATLATGMNSHGHGVIENGYALDPKLPNFMRSMQSNGWATGLFGKSHFRPHYSGLYQDYTVYGYDVVHNTEDARGGEWLDWVRTEHPEHFDDVLSSVWAAGILPEFSAYGPDNLNIKARVEKLRKEKGLTGPATDTDGPLPFPTELSQTEWITGHALDFLRNTPADKPVLAQLNYVQPHCPFTPPGEYLDQVEVDRIPDPLPANWETDPNCPQYIKRKKNLTRETPDWKRRRQYYFADIIHLDAQLGRVLDTLEETGRLANAVIMLLSDHGEMLFDHGLRRKGGAHYDACIRVPLIIAGPGLQKGVSCDALVQLEDFCPTIMELTGLTLPQQQPEGPRIKGPYMTFEPEDIPVIPGRSLLPFCRGETVTNWREAAYVESFCDLDSDDPRDWARTVRTQRYRYTWFPQGGEELYDLQADPGEQINQSSNADYANIREEMRERLLQAVVLQDYPRTRRNLYAFGVH